MKTIYPFFGHRLVGYGLISAILVLYGSETLNFARNEPKILKFFLVGLMLGTVLWQLLVLWLVNRLVCYFCQIKLKQPRIFWHLVWLIMFIIAYGTSLLDAQSIFWTRHLALIGNGVGYGALAYYLRRLEGVSFRQALAYFASMALLLLVNYGLESVRQL